MRRLLPLLFLLLSLPALAQEEVDLPNSTAALSGLPQPRLQVDALQHQVGSDHLGAAGWSTGFWTPPARMAPALGLSYSSFDRGFDAELPRGWRLTGILKIERDRRHRDEFVLSGPLSGRLIETVGSMSLPGAGEHFRLQTTQEGDLAATYFAQTDHWELRDGDGRNWRLEEVGATGGLSMDWRVVSVEDTSGNAIEFEYEGARLASVRFGGVPSRAVPHGLCMDFRYQRRAVPVSSAALGNLQEHSSLLSRVIVGRLPFFVGPIFQEADHATGADHCDPQWRLELDIDESEGEPLLVALTEVGIDKDKFGTPVELDRDLAEFGYEPLVRGEGDDSRGAEWTLPDLGRTRTYRHVVAPDEVHEGHAIPPADPYLEWGNYANPDPRNFVATVTESRLLDWNGDGLEDYVVTDGEGGWTVHRQYFDKHSGDRGWESDPVVYQYDDMPFHITETRQTKRDGDIYDLWFLASTRATLTDLDGDGWPDFVWNDQTPNEIVEFVPGTTAWDPNNRTRLWVRYGTGDGFEAQAREVDSPFGVVGVEDRFEAWWPPRRHNPNFYTTDPINADVEWVEPKTRGVLRMFDFDGDGWQDLVTNVGRHVALARHSGERGGGWGEVEYIDAPWAPGEARTECEYDLRRQSLSYHLTWATCEDALPEVAQPRPPGTYMDLVDVNGDGLLDKLVGGECALHAPLAGGLTGAHFERVVDGDAMVAYLANGEGWEEGREWTAPSTTLSQANHERRTAAYSNNACEFWDTAGPEPEGAGWWPSWYQLQMQEWGQAAADLLGCSFDRSIPHYRWGPDFSESQDKERLLDVDADGILDFVRGNRGLDSLVGEDEEWFRGTGEGWETEGRPLPEHWIVAAASFGGEGTRIGNSSTFALFGQGDAWAEGCELADEYFDGMYTRNVTSRRITDVLDVDGDGIADALNVKPDDRGPPPTEIPQSSPVTFGAYPRPWLLTEVRTSAGRTTSLAYRPASTVWPRGDLDEEQRMGSVADLVRTVSTEDWTTLATGVTWWDFEGGLRLDGALRGFEVAHSWATTGYDGYERGVYEASNYGLSREFEPLLERRTLTTSDDPLPPSNWGPALVGPVPFRQREWIDYDDVVDQHHRRLVSQVRTEQYGAEGGPPRQRTVEYERHTRSGQIEAVYDDAGDPADAYEVHLDWARSGTLARLARKDVWQGSDLLERTEWRYDGLANVGDPPTRGLPTDVRAAAGWLEGGEGSFTERLHWEVTYGDRGEVRRVDDRTTGAWTQTTWGFGAALPTLVNDGLTMQTTSYDFKGRPVWTNDATNRLGRRQAYDPLGRPTTSWVTDRDGRQIRVAHTDYYLSQMGAFQRTKTYGTWGALEGVSWRYFDGGGNTRGELVLDADDRPVLTTATHDLFGARVATSHPTTVAALPFSIAGFQALPPASRTWLDGFGAPRRVVRDVSAGLPAIEVRNPSAGTTITTDETGRTHETRSDGLGRLVEVRQDQQVTAQYGWDAAGRLRSFEDANGTQHSWSWDLAGRLREATGDTFGWRRYGYQGLARVSQEDSAGLGVSWEVDAHGRVLSMDVDDPAFGGSTSYVYDWDGDVVGALHGASSPWATDSVAYDALGRPTVTSRSFPGGQTPTFVEELDLQGRPTRVDYPSGQTIHNVYGKGQLLSTDWSVLGQDPAAVAFNYSPRLEPTGWSNNLGMSLDLAYARAGRVDSAVLDAPNAVFALGYSWLDNDLLSGVGRTSMVSTPSPSTGSKYSPSPHGTKTSTAPSPSLGSFEPVTNPVSEVSTLYGYDGMGRLTDVERDGGVTGDWTETFTFDAAGNLVTREDRDGQGVAYRLNALGQVDLRTAAADETLEYDGAGRVVRRETPAGATQYWYDGLGRLRMVLPPDGRWLDVGWSASGEPTMRTYPDGRVTTFGTWSHDSRTHRTVEQVPGLGYVEDGERRWTFRGADGSASWVLDDGGSVVGSREFSAYGELASGSTDLPWTDAFQGLQADPDAGLVFAGLRVFDPADGQWLQPEPLLFEGLAGAPLGDPQMFPAYRYSRNAPTVMTDPSGELAHILGPGAVLGVIGAGAEYVRQVRAGEAIDMGRIAVRGGQGFTVGAMAGATGGLSLVGSSFAGGVGFAVTEAAIERADGKELSAGSMLVDTAVGTGLGVAIGQVGARLAAPTISSSPVRLNVRGILQDPRTLWNKSAQEIAEIFTADGYRATVRQSTRGSGNATIVAVEGHSTITQIQVHAGGGRHVGRYIKISTSNQGKVKVVDPSTYAAAAGEKATVIPIR